MQWIASMQCQILSLNPAIIRDLYETILCNKTVHLFLFLLQNNIGSIGKTKACCVLVSEDVLHAIPGAGWPPSGRNKIHWLFPDQIQFFTDQNTAVLRPICLLVADKWQIPFTSSLKCTSLIIQTKQIKSLNSFLAQNVLKVFIASSERSEREKKSTLFKKSKYLLQHIFCAKIMKSPDFSLLFLVFKIFLTNLQNSLTFPWPWRKIKFPWLFPDQWPPWGVKPGNWCQAYLLAYMQGIPGVNPAIWC